MTRRQLEILQHALGVDKHGQTKDGFAFPVRNHFCAGDADEADCRALVDAGLMRQHKRTEWLPYFNCSVTDTGIAAMKAASPHPPKLSRDQLRYRAFRAADSGESFGSWLRSGRYAVDKSRPQAQGNKGENIVSRD